MSHFSTLRTAELSTLSNLSYSKNLSGAAYGWSSIAEYSNSYPSGLSVTSFKRGNDIVVSFRGTDSFSDLGADSSFITGRWNDQFQEAVELIADLRRDNRGANITLTGHSLGGGIAQVLAKMFRLNAMSFDAPGAEAITRSAGYRKAEQEYAQGLQQQEPGHIVNYVSKRSVVSSVGTHIGEKLALDPLGAQLNAITIISVIGLFAGGPISFFSFIGLGIGNALRRHPISHMERALWVSALLEEQLSLEQGTLVEVQTRRSAVPELRALGGNPNDSVSLFRDRYSGALQATLTRENDKFVLRSADMKEKITLAQAADGGFDCLIERVGVKPITCRLRFDASGQPRVEVDTGSDGHTDRIVQSGRHDSGMMFTKTSYVAEDGSPVSTEEYHESDDGLQKLVLRDLDGDGFAEQRQQLRRDTSGNQLAAIEHLNHDGTVVNELRLRTEAGRQLTVYELIINGHTESQGFISQPTDEALIARITGLLNGQPDLRELHRDGGMLTDTLTVSLASRQLLAQDLATQFVDLQLDAFLQHANDDALGNFPSLLPSQELVHKFSAELAQFADQSELDVRVNPDNEVLLVASDRLVLIRSDGSIRRQQVHDDRQQTLENIDADGFLASRISTTPLVDGSGGRSISYDFHYRGGASARLDIALAADLGELAALRLNSPAFTLDATYRNGELIDLASARVDGRELSPAACKGLATQLAGMSVDELQSAFRGLQEQVPVGADLVPSVQALSDTLADLRGELLATTDQLGTPLYISREERRLMAITQNVSTLIDGLSLLNALKTGEPLPVLTSGLRLATGLDMLDGSRDLPGLGGAASAASAVLSLYGLAQALEDGDGVAALSAAAYATAGLTETALLLQKAGLVETLPSSVSTIGSSLNEALPYISLVNSIAHGDKTGVAVAIADIAMMKVVGAYAVPVLGWAYAVFSLVDALFTEVPDPWGHGRFVWREGALTLEAAGETGGEQAVRNVMETVLAAMNGLIDRVRLQNPGSQLGIIANRMPGLIMGMDGYRFTDIDGLTGIERNPALRFDTSGRPYTAEPGSPASFVGLVEAILRSALEREAIAPLWEVRTGWMQTTAGDPKAGLREEERAGSDGLLALPVSGNTQMFRPVALDLDGDGIERIARASGVLFDVDSSGFRKRTGWIGADDAFLVLDRNYNGLIESGREMFSNAVVALARRGLAGMAWTDANYDGRLTAADPVWDELRLWRDLDGDASQQQRELLTLAELGISELNYAMSTYTRNGQKLQMASPDLDADRHGVRVHPVPQGILIESSEDRGLSLLVFRIDDQTVLEPGRDGVEGIEDVELLMAPGDLLANDLFGGFAGRELTLAALTDVRHGSAFIDPNGIVHFRPEADYDGSDAGFSYQVVAGNGEVGQSRVEIRLASVNDAPVLGEVDNEMRAVYSYEHVVGEFNLGGGLEATKPVYTPGGENGLIDWKTGRPLPVAWEATGKGRVVGKDIDDDPSTLRYALVSQPQYGEVTLDATGSFNYTSWKRPGEASDRIMLDGEYAAWFGGTLYNQHNMYGHAVHPTSDAFEVRITDPQGASSVVTVTVPHYGPYLPPLPPGGGKKPIAIDLDGDGFEFVNVDDSDIFFDVTGDGWKRRTSWIGKDDGLLVADLDHDGKIDRPDEIAFAGQREDAQTDLEGLAHFDSNQDGRLDASDADWRLFGIWQDRDQDGMTDDGEFLSLDGLGVASVLLASDGQFQVISGQTVHGIGRLVMVDGSERALADVTLAFSQERQLPGDGRSSIPASPFSPSGTVTDGSPDKELIAGRTGSDVMHGAGGDDLIFDEGGNDLVTGGDGNDTLFTGADHDFVDAGRGNDVVTTGTGDDMVFGGDGDDLILLQQGQDIAFGGSGNDLLSGEAGNDVLSGDMGDDQLFGGDGADALFGGAGDDLLDGVAGDDLLDGGQGNDLLDGGSGADRLAGGPGDDVYRVDESGDQVDESNPDGTDSGGSDTVQTLLDDYRLGDRLENLVLLDARRAASPVSGHGNSLANQLTGNPQANRLFAYAGNDRIDGGGGADLLVGGQGDDSYVVDHADDRVIELEAEGIDCVMAGVSYRLPAHVEHLQLSGRDNIHALGNALDNSLRGNAGANLLDGGGGADTMAGGAGDDIYRVDDAFDQVIEARDEGIDTVWSSLDWQLGDNQENLIFAGSADLRGLGNALDNLLRGNRGSNLLQAGAGNDWLIGGEGNDVLVGGDGDDSYLYQWGDGLDSLNDGDGRDSLRFGDGIRLEQIAIRMVDTAAGRLAQLRFLDTHGEESRDDGVDIHLAKNDGRVAPAIEEVVFDDGRIAGIEQLLTGARTTKARGWIRDLTGGRDDDILIGNRRDNQLDGGVGNDALLGDDGGDTLRGGGGNDFFGGGRHDDLIHTGTGHNLIAFNQHDGSDTVVTAAGAINTLSFGSGIALSDLWLQRSSNDLLIRVGHKDRVRLQDWYAGDDFQTLKTLQVIEASKHDCTEPTVTQIDVGQLAARFDAAGNVSSAKARWNVMPAGLDRHLAAGTDVIGGELALDYARHDRPMLDSALVASALYLLDPALAGQQLVIRDGIRG